VSFSLCGVKFVLIIHSGRKWGSGRRLFIANVNGWQGFDLIILQLNCCRRVERREREYCAHLTFYDSFHRAKLFAASRRKELFIAIMELEKPAVFHWNQFEKTKWDRFLNKKPGPINKITLELRAKVGGAENSPQQPVAQ
jgi:hypothetical protein